MKSISQFFLLAMVALFAVACSQAPKGEKVEGTDAKKVDSAAVTAATVKDVQVDVAASKIEWLGTKVGGQHNGDLKIKSGSIKVDGGKIVGGSFILDMASITVLDLKDKMKADLEKHLKDGDFFETNKFPEGKFEITAVKEEKKDGSTHVVEGNLTLKGVTKGVSIPANVTVDANGAVTATTPQFVIDRQQFGITYKGMKDTPINDGMGIKITLSAK